MLFATQYCSCEGFWIRKGPFKLFTVNRENKTAAEVGGSPQVCHEEFKNFDIRQLSFLPFFAPVRLPDGDKWLVDENHPVMTTSSTGSCTNFACWWGQWPSHPWHRQWRYGGNFPRLRACTSTGWPLFVGAFDPYLGWRQLWRIRSIGAAAKEGLRHVVVGLDARAPHPAKSWGLQYGLDGGHITLSQALFVNPLCQELLRGPRSVLRGAIQLQHGLPWRIILARLSRYRRRDQVLVGSAVQGDAGRTFDGGYFFVTGSHQIEGHDLGGVVGLLDKVLICRGSLSSCSLRASASSRVPRLHPCAEPSALAKSCSWWGRLPSLISP